MANRISAYHVLRKVHQYTAFVIAGFLFMYFITGFILTHPDLFGKDKPVVNSSIHLLSLPKSLPQKRLPEAIQEQLGISGKNQGIHNNEDGSTEYEFVRPGNSYRVILSPERKTAKVIHTEQTLRQTLVMFHRLDKYGGGAMYDVYIFIMDLTGVALILFSVSGLYLFLKTIKKKLIGWVFLAASVGYTLWVVLAFMTG